MAMALRVEGEDFNSENDVIADEELLYRCVFYGRNLYKIQDKVAYVSGQAFADRGKCPSVDRAELCNHSPAYSQKDTKDGVVSLITKDIRMIDTVVQNDLKGRAEFTYKIDVISRKTPENSAHAQIEPSPEYRNDKPFRKLQERLAHLANARKWEIEPYELRDNS